jgi:hypothetical protein
MEVLGVNVAWSHVVGEDVHELGLVLRLEKVGEDTGWKSREGLIGRGEHSERSFPRQGVDEVGRLERRDEGGQVRRGHGEVDDGLAPTVGLSILFDNGHLCCLSKPMKRRRSNRSFIALLLSDHVADSVTD